MCYFSFIRLFIDEEEGGAMIINLLLVAVGGGIGAVLRYAVILISATRRQAFYMATFIVNIVGSFFIGIAIHHIINEPQWYALLATGVLGGFTTFSTFAFDIVRLMNDKDLKGSILYPLLTLFLGIIAVSIGYTI